MRVLISGATGLVGSALFEKLNGEGHAVNRLVRSVAKQSGFDVVWDPLTGGGDGGRLEGYDAVVHLAGEGVAAGRWTEKRKKKIRDSRVLGTQNLAKCLAALADPPKVFAVASAVGFYGDRGQETLDEQSESGSGFLSEEFSAAAGNT